MDQHLADLRPMRGIGMLRQHQEDRADDDAARFRDEKLLLARDEAG